MSIAGWSNLAMTARSLYTMCEISSKLNYKNDSCIWRYQKSKYRILYQQSQKVNINKTVKISTVNEFVQALWNVYECLLKWYFEQLIQDHSKNSDIIDKYLNCKWLLSMCGRLLLLLEGASTLWRPTCTTPMIPKLQEQPQGCKLLSETLYV
jgi:hypothetical protein